MKQWKGKNKYKFWHSPLSLIVLFCILVLFAYNMIGLVQKERETNKNKITELNKIDDLRMREALLSKDIERLGTDEGVEESVRDKFQVVKPGEKMVVIVDENVKKDESPNTPVNHSFWGYIKRLFSK
ncbi:MAG: septum formation initiator family protein [Patescibacteria group bacterium]